MWRTRLLPLASIVTLLWAGGCETDNVSFFIAGNVLPQGESGSSCSVDTGGTLAVPNGRFNIEHGTAYKVFPLYTNQLQGSRNPLGADPNGIHVKRAEITIRDTSGEAIGFGGDRSNPFSVATATFVPSGEQAVGGIVAIPEAYRQALFDQGRAGQTIVVGIKAITETNGDQKIGTEEWRWPLDLCAGDCLFECDETGTMTEGETTCCTPGQDQVCTMTAPCF